MKDISIRQARKIGFFSSLAMLLGCVIGIGIFFKNNSVLKATEWSGLSTLLAWIVGGLISLTAAVSFSEIAWMKGKRSSGFVSWSEKVGGLKYGYFTRFSFSFFYFGMLAPLLCVFGSETLINILKVSGAIETIPDVWVHILLGMIIFILFAVTAQISIRTSGVIQQVTTVLKFLPLIITIVVGIVLPATNYLTVTDTSGSYPRKFGENAFSNGQPFTGKGLIAALPAVLFAYDSFLNVSNLHGRMKDPKKLSSIVLFGMIGIIVLYSLLVISQTLHGVGMVSGRPFGESNAHIGLFGQTFTGSLSKAFGIFVTCFIAFSTFGVINGYSLGGIVLFNEMLETDSIFGSRWFKSKLKSEKKDWASFGCYLAISMFWLTLMGIPAIITNNDAYIDGFSNFPTLFLFALYGTTILLYTLKRSHFADKNKFNNVFFNIFAWAAVIGIYFVIAYSLLYNLTTRVWFNSEHAAAQSSWGLFRDQSKGWRKVTHLHESVLFLSLLVIFFAAPAINYVLIKKYYKIDWFKTSTFDDTSFLDKKIVWKFANK